MGMVLRRLWKTVGVWGTVTILVPLVLLCIWAFRSPREDPIWAIILLILSLYGLVQLANKFRGYQRPQATKHYADVVPPLLASTEEFGLLLRPFGGDGETFLRQYEMTRRGKYRLTSRAEYADNLTMEQVFAQATQRAAKQRVYALVDQGRQLAPPGAVYVQVKDGTWQTAITAMLERAYFVILWLPAGQNVRKHVQWEINEIVRLGLQKRTIIVMPPPNNKAAYRLGVKNAAELLAFMETATGEAKAADPLRQQFYKEYLGDRTIVMKFVQAADGSGLTLARRMIAERKPLTWQRAVYNVLLSWLFNWYSFSYWSDRWRNGRVNALSYEQGMIKLLAVIGVELKGQPFAARYPHYQPRKGKGTPAADPEVAAGLPRELHPSLSPRQPCAVKVFDRPTLRGSGLSPA
jgi:hypothetical protein